MDNANGLPAHKSCEYNCIFEKFVASQRIREILKLYMTEQTKTTQYKPGMVVKVHQKIKETNTKGEEKERIQIFEGIIIALRHGGEAGATITVRKVSDGVGVERIYPIHSPVIDHIEIVREYQVRRARLNYLEGDFKRRMKEKKT